MFSTACWIKKKVLYERQLILFNLIKSALRVASLKPVDKRQRFIKIQKNKPDPNPNPSLKNKNSKKLKKNLLETSVSSLQIW